MARVPTIEQLTADLCEIARNVDSRLALHDAWLDVLDVIGFDRALIMDDQVPPGPLSTLAARNPLELAFEHARHDARRYLSDYRELRRRASPRGGALVIGVGDRWLRVFHEQLEPRGERHALMLSLHAGARQLAIVTLSRDRPCSGFRSRDIALATGLVPILSLGDLAWSRHASAPESVVVEALSARERAITDLISRGLTNPEIARLLGSSPNTVRNQVSAIFRKLGVSTRAELAGLGRQ